MRDCLKTKYKGVKLLLGLIVDESFNKKSLKRHNIIHVHLLTSGIFNVCLLLLHGVQVSGQRSIAIGDVSLSNTPSESESDNEVLLSMLSIEYCSVNLCQI